MPVSLDGVPGTSWDDELQRAGGHFLQCAAWQSVQEALGSRVCHADSGGDWMWAGHGGTSAGVRYLYVPAGPTVTKAASFTECIINIAVSAQSRRMAFIRIEPAGAVDLFELMNIGGREVRAVQPRHTWLLDISQDEQMLRRGMTKGHRGSINAAARRGLTFRSSADPADIGVLIAMVRATQERARGFHGNSDRYYRILAEHLMPVGRARLYVADHDGAPVAAALAFDFNGTRHYAHAGADPRARALSAQAPLVWQMICDAREQGMHTFDFWGVLPRPKPGHPWSGFTQFKQAFGGRLEERAGTWEVPIRTWRHRIHRTARLLARR